MPVGTTVGRHICVAATFVATALFLWAYIRQLGRPSSVDPTSGWWAWWDQGHYLRSALAWARGDLDPESHWYPVGYPLLGALSLRLFGFDPFFLTNLFSLVASLYLSVAIGVRLGIGPVWSAAAFLGGTLVLPLTATSWVVPWTSTPAAPLALGCILAAIAFAERPSAGNAFLCALCGGLLLAFRPGDALTVLLPELPLMAYALRNTGVEWRRAFVRALCGGLMGFGFVSSAVAALHIAIFGLAASPYMELQAAFGFEPRLLFLRWVTMVVDPRPFILDGQGIATATPWVIPGLAGMVLAILSQRGRRLQHLMVIAPTFLSLAAYLTYRDINPQSLWMFGLNHYFKFILIVLALYAALFVRALLSIKNIRPVAVAAVVTALAFCWRVELLPAAEGEPVLQTGRQFGTMLQPGFGDISDGYLVPADNMGLNDFHLRDHMWVAEHLLQNRFDFSVFPRGRGMLIVPLRLLPPGEAEILFAGRVTPLGLPPRHLRQRIVFGVPCWIDPRPCSRYQLVPRTSVAPGALLLFSDRAAPFLGNGFSAPEPWGRWTDGPTADVAFIFEGVIDSAGYELAVEAGGFIPPGQSATRVAVFAGAKHIADWNVGSEVSRLKAHLPASAIGQDGSVKLRFKIANARSPAEFNGDLRRLGLSFRTLQLNRLSGPQNESSK